MKNIQPDLWQTSAERPAPGLTTHAYLLTRHDGNILFYNTSHREEIEHMETLGGVAYQYLSHRDEVGPSLALIKNRFKAKLGGHIAEKDEFAAFCEPDIIFDKREIHLDNIEVIPTPGHSPGSTCFVVNSPTGKRYLFTGDTLYFAGEKGWRAGFIPGISDRDALAASLKTLRNLEPDVVISSAFSGASGFQEMSAAGQWSKQVDEAMAQLLE